MKLFELFPFFRKPIATAEPTDLAAIKLHEMPRSGVRLDDEEDLEALLDRAAKQKLGDSQTVAVQSGSR